MKFPGRSNFAGNLQVALTLQENSRHNRAPLACLPSWHNSAPPPNILSQQRDPHLQPTGCAPTAWQHLLTIFRAAMQHHLATFRATTTLHVTKKSVVRPYLLRNVHFMDRTPLPGIRVQHKERIEKFKKSTLVFLFMH